MGAGCHSNKDMVAPKVRDKNYGVHSQANKEALDKHFPGSMRGT
jgi:hypothetical protein